MRQALQKIAELFDFRDAMFFVGIASLAYGLWLIEPAYMYIIVGAIFVVLTTWRA